MKLVVKDSGNFTKVIHGITLEKGHVPALSALTEEQRQQFHIPDIEPAIWFKILLLESAIIDCALRNVTWFTSKPADESSAKEFDIGSLLRRKTGVQRISESTFLTSDHLQYMSFDFDEVFLETKAIVQRYLQAGKKDAANAEIRFYEQMFSVLHRFILPAVTLKLEDKPHLQAALEFQLQQIENQDGAICAMNDELQVLANKQFELREQYYKQMYNCKRNDHLQLAPDVAMLLYNHVQEDLSHYSQQLTEVQTDVNLVKEKLKKFGSNCDTPVGNSTAAAGCRSSVAVNSSEKYQFNDKTLLFVSNQFPERFNVEAQLRDFSIGHKHATDVASTTIRSHPALVSNLQLHLTRLRKVRDQIFDRYKTVLHIREILGEYVCDRVIVRKDNAKQVSKRQIIHAKLKTKSWTKRKQRDPLHAQYLELEDSKQEKSKETSELLEQKVQMISVKEAIRLAINELKTESLAFGVDVNHSGSLRSTDVNKQGSLPAQWLSVREQVAHALEDTSSPIFPEHIQACQRVILQCNMFHKLRSKYLLSESDSPDNISIDSNMLTNVLEQSTHLSFYDSLSSNKSIYCSPATAVPATPFQNIRRHPKGSTRNKQAMRNRETCVYDDGDDTDGLGGLSSLICVTRQTRLQQQYTREPSYSEDRDSLMEFDDVADDDVVILHDTSPEYAQKTLETMKQDIHKHMHQMCLKFQALLNKRSPSDYQQLWSAYERLYFAEVMFSLERLYALAYSNVLIGLEQSLPKLTPSTLAMDNELILQLFEDVPSRDSNDSGRSSRYVTSDMFDHDVDDDHVSTLATTTASDEAFEGKMTKKSRVLRAQSESVLDSDRHVTLKRSDDNENDIITVSDPISETHGLQKQARISGSDINMHLAEQLMENSASGMLRQEVAKSMRSRNARSGSKAASDVSSVISTDSVLAHTSVCSVNSVPPDSVLSSVTEEPVETEVSDNAVTASTLTATGTSTVMPSMTPTVEQLSVNTLNDSSDTLSPVLSPSGRSKYANVLEQINLDFARHVESSIRIFYPTSVNYLETEQRNMERNTWPLAAKDLDGDDLEFASDAMKLQRHGFDDDSLPLSVASAQSQWSTGTSVDVAFGSQHSFGGFIPAHLESIISRKSVRIKAHYLQQFRSVIDQLQLICREPVPTLKLQLAYKALHDLSKKVQQIHHQVVVDAADAVAADDATFTGSHAQMMAPSADDLTDFLVVLLCNCDLDLVKSLYLNVHIMRDHICERFETGPFGFALMQLTICLHFLQERIVMQRGLVENRMAAACGV